MKLCRRKFIFWSVFKLRSCTTGIITSKRKGKSPILFYFLNWLRSPALLEFRLNTNSFTYTCHFNPSSSNEIYPILLEVFPMLEKVVIYVKNSLVSQAQFVESMFDDFFLTIFENNWLAERSLQLLSKMSLDQHFQLD